MPARTTRIEETQIIKDILRQLRRHRANAISQEPIWTHDTFTAPATYQLTSIPYGINVLADNGAALSEGTDYTVDYSTGLITFTVGRTAGHVIFVSYVTNGELVAASGPADLGWVVSDNFNRADSTGPSSTINPASDGGTWTEDFGFGASWGILSNHGLMTNAAPGSGYGVPWIARDVGSNSAHVEVTWTRDSATVTDTSGSVYAWLAFDPVIHSGYLMFVNLTTWGIASFDGVTGTTLSTTTWSLTYDVPRSLVFTYSSSGLLTATLDGGTPQTVTDSTYLTSSANTYVGLGANRSYDLFDNFLARPF